MVCPGRTRNDLDVGVSVTQAQHHYNQDLLYHGSSYSLGNKETSSQALIRYYRLHSHVSLFSSRFLLVLSKDFSTKPSGGTVYRVQRAYSR